MNECKEHKPCDQTCYNTEGSYYCTCRDGFMLQSDRQTCKKIGKLGHRGTPGAMEEKYATLSDWFSLFFVVSDETNDLATEARDMENDLDVDYDSLDIRLRKLEQVIVGSRVKFADSYDSGFFLVSSYS